MPTWQQILILVCSPAAAVAAVAYIARQFISRALQIELARYKADLQRELSEFQTRFSMFHEREIETVGQLYGRLAKAMHLIKHLTQTVQFADDVPLKEKKQHAADAYNELQDFFIQHRIYLDPDVCNKIDTIMTKIRSSFFLFDYAVPHEFKADPTGLWEKAYQQIETEAEPLRFQLERTFRELVSQRNQVLPKQHSVLQNEIQTS